MSCRIEPENIKKGCNGYGKNNIAGFNPKTFERGHIPLKPAGEHGIVNSFRSFDGSNEKDSDKAHKDLHALAALSVRAHIPGTDDPHGFFHENKDVAVEKRKLRNEKRRQPQLSKAMANTRKGCGGNKQKRRADGEGKLDQNRKEGKPSR